MIPNNILITKNLKDFYCRTEFHGLDSDVLVKALQHLQGLGKAEIMDYGDSQGVKFL